MTATAPFARPTVTVHARGAAGELLSRRDGQIVIAGPVFCVAGETRIYDPIADTWTPIVDLWRKGVAPTVLTMDGPAQAEVPFLKGFARLYRVTMRSGQSFVSTAGHRVFTRHGWTSVERLQSGERLRVSAPAPPVSTAERSRRASLQDALRLIHTPSDSTDHYLAVPVRHDGQPQSAGDTDQVPVPSRGDVLERSPVGQHTDDHGVRAGHTRPYQLLDRLSTCDYSDLSDHMGRAGYRAASGTSRPSGASIRSSAPSRIATAPPMPTSVTPLRVDSTAYAPSLRSVSLRADEGTFGLDSHWLQSRQQYAAPSIPPDTHQSVGISDRQLDAYSPSSSTSKSNYTAQWDTVSRVEYERSDYFYDLHVPGAENYLAEGVFHHNSGKTFPCVLKLHLAATKYPGMRGLFCRKENTALAGSTLVTFKRGILDKITPDYPVVPFGGSKMEPPGYRYPNGSFIAVGGVDDARIMGSEYDIILVDEATQVTEGDWETLVTRRRWGVMPYQQIIGACNPDSPSHWIWKRYVADALPMLFSEHVDNPKMHNGIDWTDFGRTYLNDLEKMTGHRRERLLYGRWVVAEGAVYPAFDRRVHVKEVDCTDWATVVGLDLGTRNPTCILTVRHSGDRIHIESEFYRRGLGSDEIEQEAVTRYEQAKAEWMVVDPSAAGLIVTLGAKGLDVRKADNDVLVGISRVTSALADITVDPSCVNTIAEFESYAYPEGQRTERDTPVKANDHAMDVVRYLCMEIVTPQPPGWDEYDTDNLGGWLTQMGVAV